MEPLLLRLAIVAAIVLAAVVAGRWWQRRNAAVRSDAGRFARDELLEAGLDPDQGGVLALLLGSPTCGPCRTVRDVLTEVAADHPGFRWVYRDAADVLELAAAHHVLRVPTLFVLAPDGRILARTSGVPARSELERVLERTPSVAPPTVERPDARRDVPTGGPGRS